MANQLERELKASIQADEACSLGDCYMDAIEALRDLADELEAVR
jgi:hypothetical protein